MKEWTLEMWERYPVYVVCGPYGRPLALTWDKAQAEEILDNIRGYAREIVKQYPNAFLEDEIDTLIEDHHITKMQGPTLATLFKVHGK